MPVFKTKEAAYAYASKKQKQGYSLDICGGHAGDYKYIVTIVNKNNKNWKTRRGFSPYVPSEDVYSTKTNNKLVKEIKSKGGRRLRTKGEIKDRAKTYFRRRGFDNIKVNVEDIHDRGGVTDAEIASKEGKVHLTIHPIHQYTTHGNFMETLKHELGHVAAD